MTTYNIGYARVSTVRQDISLQVNALENFGVEKIYSEKLSGKTSHKPELEKALDELRGGDSLVVYRIDRLSRSLRELLDITSVLVDKGARLVVTQQPHINIDNPEGRMQFYMAGVVSEYERDVASLRTLDGLAAARARGRVGGRKAKLSRDQQEELVKLYKERNLTVRQIASKFDVSSPTVYRALHGYLSAV
jgi:DNA invertase Pin-like site-specific DNA recombinase